MKPPHSATSGPVLQMTGQGKDGDKLQTIQGTLQRVNYPRRQITVIGEGKIWHLIVSADCQLWFNDAPAILRCFHPLDPVTVTFDDSWTARVLSAWEPWVTHQAQTQNYRIAV